MLSPLILSNSQDIEFSLRSAWILVFLLNLGHLIDIHNDIFHFQWTIKEQFVKFYYIFAEVSFFLCAFSAQIRVIWPLNSVLKQFYGIKDFMRIHLIFFKTNFSFLTGKSLSKFGRTRWMNHCMRGFSEDLIEFLALSNRKGVKGEEACWNYYLISFNLFWNVNLNRKNIFNKKEGVLET